MFRPKKFVLFIAFSFCASTLMALGGMDYAGSNKTLQEFKRRFSEIETDDSFGEVYYGVYAASNKTLQEFKKRFSEIETDDSFGEVYYGAYAASDNTLAVYKRRFAEISNDDNDIGELFY
jgi:hypothetical protein